jgi:hypothetical protein
MGKTIGDNFPYAGVIFNIALEFKGVYFDGQTAWPKSKGRTYDNPFN